MRETRKRGRKVTAQEVPKCFTSIETYQDWKEVARRSGALSVKNGFCVDCTAPYQGQMIRDGRCAHPGTTFHRDGDGFIKGVRPGVQCLDD